MLRSRPAYPIWQVSERGYSLQPGKKLLEINTMVRLKGLAFKGSQGGEQGRTLRGQTATGARAGRAATGLSFLCEDMHNDILMALDPEATGEGGMTAQQVVAAREAEAAAAATAREAWLEQEEGGGGVESLRRGRGRARGRGVPSPRPAGWGP